MLNSLFTAFWRLATRFKMRKPEIKRFDTSPGDMPYHWSNPHRFSTFHPLQGS